MIVALGESNEGCEHYRIEFTENDTDIEVHILSNDPAEVNLLRNHLFIKADKAFSLLNFDNDNKATIMKEGQLHFDGQLFIDFSNSQPWVARQFKLAETRMVSEYNDTKTSYRHEHSDVHEHEHKHKPRSRIDGHTHFVAAFPMKNAMEKVLEEKKDFYIPSLVVLKILKNKGIFKPNHENFLLNNKVLPTDKNVFKQKDMSGDLIKEDFAIDIPYLTDDERSFCLADNTAYYLSVNQLKEQLSPEEWGDFCNGFDLPATHACDFTEHMENVYNLRNWFGKDTTFLRAQLEIIYEEYEKQGIGYAEIPAGFLKKQEDLDKFVAISEEIETARAIDRKEPIIIRPGLSIARLLEPRAFRSTLLSFIPIILKNPSLASISILAHETNPTTEHLKAIKDFTDIINRNRPGFTIEVHAGETAAYGEVNLSEARMLAIYNPLTYIRAGHATYGNHKEKALDNFIEEKCPISNLTLIDVEPEVQVDVLEGIIAGNTNMFWGSDGAIYDPLYSPVEQEKFYMKLMSHPDILKELEKRFKSNLPKNYSPEHFENHKKSTIVKLQQQFDRNKDNEAKYIHFKTVEKLFHGLKNDILKLETLMENIKLFDPLIDIEYLEDKFLSVTNTFNQINSQIKDNLSINDLRNILTSNEASLTTLRGEIDRAFQEIKSDNSESLINAVMKDLDPILSDIYDKKSSEIVYYANMYNKLYKLFDAGDIDVLFNHPFLEDDVKFFKTTENPSLQDIKWFIQQNLSKPVTVEDGLLVLCGNDNNECKAPVRKLYELCLPLYTAYKASRESDANVFSPMHYQKIADIFSKIDVETREKIRAIPPSKTPNHKNLGIIIDPSLQYNTLMKRAYERNNTSLNVYKKQQNFEKSDDAILLFGSPEFIQGDEQITYMKNMYNFMYNQLDGHSQILLLGNLTEGINPLIYQIIEDYPHLKNKDIVHIIANDENINTMRKDMKKGNFVPFHLTNKPRQEAHIGYANFLQEHNVSNIIMIGGKAAIWSDTKNALAERVINGKTGSESIKFYSDGFGTTRSSSAYAKSYVNQIIKDSGEEMFCKNTFNALDEKYYDGNIKHSVNHRNLAFFYFAFSDYLIELDNQPKLNDDFTLRQFFSVLDPTPEESLSDTDIDDNKLFDLTNQLDKYFQEFLNNSEPEIVSKFKSMLVHYGVDNLFKNNLYGTRNKLIETESPSLKVS